MVLPDVKTRVYTNNIIIWPVCFSVMPFSVLGMDNAVLIGVCVAAGILLLLLMVAACFIVGCMRRRSRRPNQVKIPPEGFDNKVHAQY